MEFETFGALVRWLLTPAGLGVAVFVVVDVVRQVAKRRAAGSRVWAWVLAHLWHVSVVAAVVLAVGAYAVQRFGLASYVEEFWPLVLLVLGSVTWGTSQAVYSTVKASKRWNEEGD